MPNPARGSYSLSSTSVASRYSRRCDGRNLTPSASAFHIIQSRATSEMPWRGNPPPTFACDAGEPDLFDALRIARSLAPEDRSEALSLFVERERVTGERDVGAQHGARKLEAINRAVDQIGDAERYADGINRLPDTDEVDDLAGGSVKAGMATENSRRRSASSMSRACLVVFSRASSGTSRVPVRVATAPRTPGSWSTSSDRGCRSS